MTELRIFWHMMARISGCKKEEEVMLGWKMRNNEELNYNFALFTKHDTGDQFTENHISRAYSDHRDDVDNAWQVFRGNLKGRDNFNDLGIDATC
jgi:hypothetical protein